MADVTTHDLQTEHLHQEYRGDGPDPEPATTNSTEQKSAKQELEELIGMIRAHINFQRETLRFTNESLAEIRKSLAGIESE
jgi:hypothetical protein